MNSRKRPPRYCSYEGCENIHDAKGYCTAHYQQFRAGKPLTPVPLRRDEPKRFCSYEGCDEPHSCKGFCTGHYQQHQKGRPLTPLGSRLYCAYQDCREPYHAQWLCAEHFQQRKEGKILKPLRRRTVSLETRLIAGHVVLDNGCWQWTKTRNGGYGQLTVNRKTLKAHRIAYEVWVGPIPEGCTIHHKCANTKCINPEHLELATNRENVAEMFERQAYLARIKELEDRVTMLELEIQLLSTDRTVTYIESDSFPESDAA